MNEVRNVLVGFVLGKEESQISYYDRRTGEPVQVPTKLGTNLFGFPTALAKLAGRDEWHFGHEADLAKREKGALCVQDFYDCICQSGPVTVDGNAWMPEDLLAIYLRQALALLGLRDILRSISCILFTTEELTEGFVRNLRAALLHIGFSREQFGMQDFMESFYHYTYRQSEDVFTANVALFAFSGNDLSLHLLVEDRATRPRLVRVRKLPSLSLPAEPAARDQAFLAFAREAFEKERVSGVFLLGEELSTDWMGKSLPFLLSGHRRVFYGDNLFVKGACYAALEKKERHSVRIRQFVSDSMVRTGVGMDMLLGGNPTYYPFFSFGTSWFEAEGGCEFLLEGRDFLVFSLRSMDGKKRTSRQMPLPGLSNRPDFITRIRLGVRCLSPDKCEVTAEDLGFGSFFPATHKIWHGELELD